MGHGKMVVSCQTGDVNEKYTSSNRRSSVHCHVISSQEDTPDSVKFLMIIFNCLFSKVWDSCGDSRFLAFVASHLC